MGKIYLISAIGSLITAGFLLNYIKNDTQYNHCILQAAKLDGTLATINQVQNVHYLATEYAATSIACKGRIPKLVSTPSPAILADAKKPEILAEGKKKADERKEGNPLL
jgi:hypothetical protein